MELKKGAILTHVAVEDYAAEGKSVSHIDGKVIFIENAVPGDVVDLRVVKNKKDWAEGIVINMHQLAPERVEPFCSHFGICGGCKWQNLPYEEQLNYKAKQVKDQFRRIGQILQPDPLPIIESKEQRYYRNKMEYTFSNKKYLTFEEIKNESVSSFQNVAGFHATGIFDKVVDIDTCYLQQEPTNNIRKVVKEFAIQKDYPFYDIKNHTGWLRTMQVRLCTTGELMVNIVFAYEKPSWQKEMLDHILEQRLGITTLLYTINTKWNDSIYDLQPISYYGKGYVFEKLENFHFKIGPKSFFQTNTKQAENLYRITRDFAELKCEDVVYDLYCGTGSIGIFLSRLAKKVIGVELIEAAIDDAKENAQINKVDNVFFYTGDVSNICTDAFFEQNGKPNVIVVDPPRAGLSDKLIQQIIRLNASIVVYVSCNCATQARDLKMLNEHYSVEKIQPVDMFPQTHHIENVVQLKRRNK